MSEVSRPKRIFAKSTISAVVFISVIYTLVNVSYVSLPALFCPKLELDFFAVLRRLGESSAWWEHRYG